MKEFIQKINREYGISATTLKPFHSVWKLTAPSQIYILKKIKTDPNRFSMLANVINGLYNRGLLQLNPVRPTRSGKLYLEFGNGFFSLSPWYAGEKPSFRDLQHLKRIGRCFGQIHEFSRQTSFPKNLINEQGLDEYQNYHRDLETILSDLTGQNELNRIDRTVLEWGGHFLEQSRSVVLDLNHCGNPTSLLLSQKGFCHNDPAPGNIIMGHQQCYLIDFEFISCDLWLKELAHLAMRVLQATAWNEKEPHLDILLRTYHQERPLLDVEFPILATLLRFPRRFWRFCRQRYREKLPWSERHYQSRLWEIITEESKRALFFEKYHSEFFTF